MENAIRVNWEVYNSAWGTYNLQPTCRLYRTGSTCDIVVGEHDKPNVLGLEENVVPTILCDLTTL